MERYGPMVATRGGVGEHVYEVNNALAGWFWTCSCGRGSEPLYPNEQLAVRDAKAHVAAS